jgi:hypothetical protein
MSSSGIGGGASGPGSVSNYQGTQNTQIHFIAVDSLTNQSQTLYVNAVDYTISKKAKMMTYHLPFSLLDSVLPMGSNNREHKMTMYEVGDLTFSGTVTADQGAQQIYYFLMQTNPMQLVDLESKSHTVIVSSWSVAEYGGKPSYYEITASFIEVNQ